MQQGITYTLATGEFLPQDGAAAGKIAEEYFRSHEDDRQVPINNVTAEWIRSRMPECFNIIKDGKKVVGSTFVFPATKELMNAFLSGSITERQLFERITEIYPFIPETVYLCSAIVLPEYRKKGLASQALSMSVEKMIEKYKFKPELFCWAYSSEGALLAEKAGHLLGLAVFNL